MPSYVRTELCEGCEGQDGIACVYICPHDLMKLDRDGSQTGHTMKAFNQEPEQCWECYACVKSCPKQALEVRAYADIVPMGGSVQPFYEGDFITWNITFRNGTTKRFTFPVRTTPGGSINPYAGKPAAQLNNIAKPGFFNHNEQNGYREGDASELIHK